MDRADELKYIFSVRNDLLACNKIEDLINISLSFVLEQLRSQTASIFLISKDGLLERVGIRGTDKDKQLIDDCWFQEEKYQIGGSFTGRAATSQGEARFGEPQFSTNLNQDEINDDSRTKYREKLGILKSAMSVPLNGRHRTYGVLEVINKIDAIGEVIADDTGIFSPEDLHWLSIIGINLSTAISNLRRKNELEILTEISQKLVEPIESDTEPLPLQAHPIYDSTAKGLVNDLTNYKVCILRLADSNNGLNVISKASSRAISWNKRNDDPRKDESSMVWRVYKRGRQKIVKDIYSERASFRNWDWIEANGLKSFACFPLTAKSKIVGTLSLFTGYPFEFYDSDQEFLHNITSLIAAFTESLAINRELTILREKRDKQMDEFVSRARIVAFSRPVEDVLHEYKNQFLSIQRKLKESENSNSSRRSQIIRELINWVDERVKQIEEGFSRNTYTAVSINDVIRNVAQIFTFEQKKRHLQFSYSYDPNLPNIMASEAEIKDIIFNLMSNAVKAVQKAGRKQGEIKVSTTLSNEGITYIQITVEDNGVGIKNEDHIKVFQRGYTTYDGGTGMGLFITEKIVDGYGGKISFNSTVGKGTKFTVKIPTKRNKA